MTIKCVFQDRYTDDMEYVQFYRKKKTKEYRKTTIDLSSYYEKNNSTFFDNATKINRIMTTEETLKNIEIVEVVYQCPIRSLENIGLLQNLRELYFTGSGLCDLTPLKNCKKLEILSEVCACFIHGLENITDLPLKQIKLNWVTNYTREELLDILIKFNKLEHVDVTIYGDITITTKDVDDHYIKNIDFEFINE
jgi:hypothetical protein